VSLSERRAPARLSCDGALLGRDRELNVLRALVDDTDRGGVGIVHGPAGIGKSALLMAASAHARSRGFEVLSTFGVQSEASFPFAALERLLHGLFDRVKALPEPQRDALLSGFGLAGSTVPDRFLVGLAALNLLSEAASRKRLVVLVDDAQWLDPASGDVVGFVARRIAAEPIAMLVTRRDGRAEDLLEMPSDEFVVDVPLGPLDDAAAGELLDRAGAEMSPVTRRRLLAIAAGNPLALAELPLSASAHEEAGEGEIVTLTGRLERSFGGRIAELDPATRALLLVAAADDDDFSVEILAATRLLAPEAGERELEAATEARLLERDGRRLRFHHPLIRSAIYQEASVPSRGAAHAAIAHVIAGEPGRRAWHRAAASVGPDDVVAGELDVAAADAQRRGAFALAARALERSAALSTNPEDAVRRLLSAAELSVQLGDLNAVARQVAAAERLDPAAGAHARVRWIWENFAGDASEDDVPARALLRDAVDARRAGDTDLALKLLIAAGTRCWWALPADAPIREQLVAETFLIRVPEHDARVLAVIAATSAVRHAGLVIGRLEHACADARLGAEDAHLLGQAAHMVGQSELAVRQLARVEAQWRAQGRLAALAQALTMRAWSSIQLGNWPAVEPAAVEGERLAVETGQPLWAAGARAGRAAAAAARGDIELATALAGEVEAQLVTTQPSNLLAVLQVTRGVAALGAGRYAEACDQLARSFDPTDPAHHYAERHGALSYLAEAALQCGRVEEARAVLARFEPLARRESSTLLEVGVSVARALLAEPGDAGALFEAALSSRAGTLPFHRARLLLAQGRWLRRTRRSADSRAPLRVARDLFDALGAVPWAERARQELRASGETSRRRVPEARDQLTPQERQIAEMAASGLSNPEIAERLFLSARTVASHLYRAFPKLGISSRSELAATLGTTAAS
jgi:DNA-binding CsgD family transcriptional regulator/tetratricopeptide (TPR) repeat protein